MVSLKQLIAQKVEIKGKVVDNRSSIPLANVYVGLGDFNTTTNFNGFFSLFVDKNNAELDSLRISHIGYETFFTNNIRDSFLIVRLKIYTTLMPEVIVSSNALNIIKKAVQRIPYNYPSAPFLLNGIFRIYRTEIDSPKVYRFFKSDAVISLYYPSYQNPESNVEVKVIQNKTIFLKPAVAPYDSSIWVGSYFVDEFVRKRSDFIDPGEVDNFKYFLSGKTVLQGKNVWIIDFESKQKNRATGTLFIDTASYAFVAAKYSRFNIKKFRQRTIESVSYDILFENVKDKWYLAKKSTQLKYRFSRASHNLTTDFISLNIADTITDPPFSRSETISKSDDDSKIVKNAPDSNWILYDSLFNRAEQEKAITYIPIPGMPKKSTVSGNESDTYNEEDIPFYKRPNYLENTRLRVTISMDHINIRSSPLSRGSLGVGFGAGIRIMPNTYVHLLEAFNFKDANKIFSSKTGLGILHSLNVSHNRKHPFYLTALAGVSFIQLTKKHENFKDVFEYFIGLGVSYPVLPKLRPFLNITYNQIFKEWGSLQTYYSTHANFSLGTFFTF